MNTVRISYYRFFDTLLIFKTNREKYHDEFNRIYKYFEIKPEYKDFKQASRTNTDLINCSIEESGNTYKIKAISKRFCLDYSTPQKPNTDTYLSLFSPVIYETKNYFLIHAGSLISLNGKSVIISAPSSFGKTTMTRELFKQGFKLLSDELAPINLEDGFIYPYPRGMGILTDMSKDIEDIPKDKIGNKCFPEYVIFLTLDKLEEQEDEKTVEIALGRIDNNIIKCFESLKGVKKVDLLHDRLFTMIRLSIEKDSMLTQDIDHVCKNNNVPIIYTLKGKTMPPDFNAQPKLSEISQKDGIFELSQHILNAHDSALLEDNFSNSRPKMIFELAGLCSNAKFFTLTVGKLEKMVELVTRIFH